MHRLNKVISQLQPLPIESIESKECNTNSFDLTMSGKMFTSEQRQFYEENGYIVVKKLLNDADIKKYYERFDELVADPKKRSPHMLVMRDVSLTGLQRKDRTSERVVTKLQNWCYDKVLWTFAKHPRIIPYVESIIGSDIRGHHFMEINKPSDPGMLSSRHPLHQDQWYFPFAPSKYIVCAWTALQKIHRNNGCLVVVPGSHKKYKLLVHSYPKPWNGPINKAYHGVQLPEKEINELLANRVHLEMEPGDTVFFHPLLIHGSGANLTDRNRRSISVHYCNSTKVDFIKGGVIAEQAIIANEGMAMAKRLSGFTPSYDQIWKAKSRQVQGDPGNFKFTKESIKK